MARRRRLFLFFADISASRQTPPRVTLLMAGRVFRDAAATPLIISG
jgi:hypothetical protein